MAIVGTNTLYGYIKNGSNRTLADFTATYMYTGTPIDSMDWGLTPSNRRLGWLIAPPYASWRIYRCALITENIPDVEILCAYLKGSTGVYCANGGSIHGYMVNMDGYGYHDHAMYGYIRTVASDPSKVVGDFSVLCENDVDAIWIGEFNSNGLALLNDKRGESAKLGFYTDTFPAAIDPPASISSYCYHAFASNPNETQIRINEFGGYIWAEDTKFAFLDLDRRKNLVEGSLVT